jgi:hypothetical protein
MTVRGNLSIYNNVAVTAWYKRNCPRSLKAAVFSALATIIQQRANLSAIPVDTKIFSPYFDRLKLIELNQTVTSTEIDGFCRGCEKFHALDGFLQKEHNRPFRNTKPLSHFWRLHVLEEVGDESYFMLAFFIDHCIANTKSVLVFHEALEDALNKPSETEPKHMVNTSTMELLPFLDDFLGTETAMSPSIYREQPPNMWTGAVQFIPARTKSCSRWLASKRAFCKGVVQSTP